MGRTGGYTEEDREGTKKRREGEGRKREDLEREERGREGRGRKRDETVTYVTSI